MRYGSTGSSSSSGSTYGPVLRSCHAQTFADATDRNRRLVFDAHDRRLPHAFQTKRNRWIGNHCLDILVCQAGVNERASNFGRAHRTNAKRIVGFAVDPQGTHAASVSRCAVHERRSKINVSHTCRVSRSTVLFVTPPLCYSDSLSTSMKAWSCTHDIRSPRSV